MQYPNKHTKMLLVLLCFLLMPALSFAAWYNSNQSGDWTTGSTWNSGSYPHNGDGVIVKVGHTVTYNGSINWTGGQIEADGGTLIINGDVDITNTQFYIKNGGSVIVNGSFTIDRSLSISGNLTVTGALAVTGDINLYGFLDVDADVLVSDRFSVNSGGVADIEGDLSGTNVYSSDNSIIAVQSDIAVSNQMSTSSGGMIVIGGDYLTGSTARTYTDPNSLYIFGNSNCVSGAPSWNDCDIIGDVEQWGTDGSPASDYITDRPAFWEDHLVNSVRVLGPTDACSSSTFELEAVTTNAGDLANNLFEWAVYGGEIRSFDGTTISSEVDSYHGYTASYLSGNGITNKTSYSITVDWTDVNFNGAYVAVRQTSEDGCTDGKWSVYTVHTKETVAPTGASPQAFCIEDSHLVSDLSANGTSVQWYDVATGGTALAANTELISGTYYASQTQNGCESAERLAVEVTVSGDFQVSGLITDASCANQADGAIELYTGNATSLIFNHGSSSVVDTGEKLLSNRSEFTIEGWIKFDKSDITTNRISLFGQNDVIEFGFSNPNTLSLWTDGNWYTNVDISSYFNDTGWHHVAAVGDHNGTSIYIDGALAGSQSGTVTNYGGSTTYSAKIGGGVWDGSGGSFTGEIGQVGYWSTALASSEIATRAAAPLAYTGDETGLLSGYNFSEGSGTTVTGKPGESQATLSNTNWSNPYTFSWTKTGDASFTAAGSKISNLSAGDYQVSVSDGNCSKDFSFTVGNEDRVLTLTCPAAGTASCFADLPSYGSLTDFINAGGGYTDSCNDPSSLTFSYEDIVSTTTGCTVVRTYTLTDGTASTTCEQQFSLSDASSPSLVSSGDLETNPNQGCYAVLNISAPSASDNCNFADPDPIYSYHPGNDASVTEVSGAGAITNGSFPVGTTTIYWRIYDDCGNEGTAQQSIVVTFPISFDGGQLQADGGPGMNPAQTSVHTYTANDAETNRSAYSYNWQIFTTGGVEVTSGFTVATNGEYEVEITFGTVADAIAAGSYNLKVTKTDAVSGCSISSYLPITVLNNDFDVSVGGQDICQTGEYGNTELEWTITMASTAAVEPYSFTYAISDASSTLCSDDVSNISFSAGNLSHTGSCAAVTMDAAKREIYIRYTVANEPGVDKQYTLTLSNTTDQFNISDPDISNNNEDGTARGVPNTSEITTN